MTDERILALLHEPHTHTGLVIMGLFLFECSDSHMSRVAIIQTNHQAAHEGSLKSRVSVRKGQLQAADRGVLLTHDFEHAQNGPSKSIALSFSEKLYLRTASQTKASHVAF